MGHTFETASFAFQMVSPILADLKMLIELYLSFGGWYDLCGGGGRGILVCKKVLVEGMWVYSRGRGYSRIGKGDFKKYFYFSKKK